MVIYIAKTYKELQKKKKPFVYLIINMAIADILDACVATILSVSFSFLGSRWFSGLFGKISLKLAYFSIVFFTGLSIFTLMIMFYAIPLIDIATSNIVIAHALRKRRAFGSSQRQAQIYKQNCKIFKLLITIFVLFASCWPFIHAQHFLSAFEPFSYRELRAHIPLLFNSSSNQYDSVLRLQWQVSTRPWAVFSNLEIGEATYKKCHPTRKFWI